MGDRFQEAVDDLENCGWALGAPPFVQELRQVTNPAEGWGRSYQESKAWAFEQAFVGRPDAYFRFKAAVLRAAAAGRPWRSDPLVQEVVAWGEFLDGSD